MRVNRHAIPHAINLAIVECHLRRLDRIIWLNEEPERKDLALVEALAEDLNGDVPRLEVVGSEEMDAGRGLFVLEGCEFLG